ncbi:MAG TPA: APC family permease [Steroidobacteraceae bacterium]|nr:APC family permease [Steroidobacteraceae bacterium]
MNHAAPVGSPGLHRGLGRFDVVALCVNSIVGAGVFAMPAGLAIDAGRWSLAVIFAAFVVVGCLAMSLAEVSSRYDVTGGPQVYAQRVFGPLTGFTVGWLFSVSRIASYALIGQVMLDYAAEVWPALAPPLPRAAALTVFTIALTAINVRGVTRGAWTGNLLTIAKLVPLGLIAIAGLWYAGWNDIPASEPREPDGLLDALNLALFACVGFDVAAIVSGEMRHPRRDLPVSILGGLAISCLLYLLLMLACYGILPDTAASKLPLTDVAEHFIGPGGATLMALAAVVSTAGGLAVQMLVSPRNIFALAEAGDLPRPVAAVHRAFRTPHVSIIVYAALSWILAITGAFKYLLAIFVIARLLVYGSTAAALIVLRRREGPAPVRIPGGVAISVIALAACIAVVATQSWQAVRDVVIVVAIGLVVRAVVRSRAGGSRVRASPP